MSARTRHQRRRRHNGRNNPTTLTGIATKALAAYGAYKIGSWAWNQLSSDDTSICREEEEEEASRPDDNSYCDGEFEIQDHPSEPEPSSNLSKPQQEKPTIARRRNHHNSRLFMRSRRARLQKCSRETISTIGSFLNSLKGSIDSLTDISTQAKKLKQLRKTNSNEISDNNDVLSKQELWNEIKVKSIARMISSVYAHSIMTLIMTVQIHLLGGKIFREQFDADSNADTSARTESAGDNDESQQDETTNISQSHQEVLMQTYEYFFQKGLNLLVHDIEEIVQKELEDWEVLVVKKYDNNDDATSTGTNSNRDEVSVASSGVDALGRIDFITFEQGIQSIRDTFEVKFSEDVESLRSSSSQQAPTPLVRYMLDFDYSEMTTNDSNIVKFIMDETLDIIESPVFDVARKDAMDLSFQVLRDRGYSGLFFAGEKEGEQKTADDFKSREVPLANIITKLKKNSSNTLYSSPDTKTEDEWADRPMSTYPNIYLYHLDRIECLKELGDVSFN
mmetsp:Transcript_25813/g.38158  ORF Transcript_25813/g.38158 Transcript_25813/m.38158 type:complete len:506 (+) Transcript_25813:84-1601(+)